MTANEYKIQTVGGVWNELAYWPALSWGAGVDEGIKWLELIAEDWTFTFKTVNQKFTALTFHLPYGP
jgi:hypothetical protein